MKPIRIVEVSVWCGKSRPCVHDCIVAYANGESQTVRMSGWELATPPYFEQLPLQWQEHFQKYQRKTCVVL